MINLFLQGSRIMNKQMIRQTAVAYQIVWNCHIQLQSVIPGFRLTVLVLDHCSKFLFEHFSRRKITKEYVFKLQPRPYIGWYGCAYFVWKTGIQRNSKGSCDKYLGINWWAPTNSNKKWKFENEMIFSTFIVLFSQFRWNL